MAKSKIIIISLLTIILTLLLFLAYRNYVDNPAPPANYESLITKPIEQLTLQTVTTYFGEPVSSKTFEDSVTEFIYTDQETFLSQRVLTDSSGNISALLLQYPPQSRPNKSTVTEINGTTGFTHTSTMPAYGEVTAIAYPQSGRTYFLDQHSQQVIAVSLYEPLSLEEYQEEVSFHVQGNVDYY